MSSVGLGEKGLLKRSVRENQLDTWSLGVCFYVFKAGVSKWQWQGIFCCCVISRLAPTVPWHFSKAALLGRFVPIPLQPYMEGKRKWTVQGSLVRKRQAFTFWKLSFFSSPCLRQAVFLVVRKEPELAVEAGKQNPKNEKSENTLQFPNNILCQAWPGTLCAGGLNFFF